MRTRLSASVGGAIFLIAAVFLAPQAFAFYPFGFFNEAGELVFITWSLDQLDNNNDDDVSGPADGLELNFELDGVDNDGFTPGEIADVFAGYEEWERVSTAFMAYFQGPTISDPVELGGGLASIDSFNMVTFESEEDAAEQGGSLAGGSFGVVLLSNTFEETNVTVGGTTFLVSEATMIDVDAVIVEAARDLATTPQGPIMKGLATLMAGSTLGLGWSPLTNFDDGASETEGVPIEDRVIALRNFDGTIGLRGVTSSMANVFMYYLEEGGSLTDSHQDLAPDDIAGVTFMYPRSDVDLFFEIIQRARTQATQGLASEPLAGTWIRAWCDADNNSGTARVPFVDTFSGLYEWGLSTNLRGNFELKGLFKQLETIGQQTFQASYTVSSSVFDPNLFEEEPGTYDTTHGGFQPSPNPDIAHGFDTLFPAEVFHESGNLFGLQNVNQGTPLVFDLISRKIISKSTQKTLDVILAAGRPMFGEANEVCPLNVVVTDTDGGAGLVGVNLLRSFRDNVLADSAVGVAMIDAYYRVAPSMARFLLDHSQIRALAAMGLQGFGWVVSYAEWLALAAGCLIAAHCSRTVLRRRRLVGAGVVGVLFFAAIIGTAPAQALLLPWDITDYVRESTDVVHGTVTSVESRWTDNNTQIVTDILICVEDTAKGRQNRESTIHLQLPTGRVGAVGRSSPDLPTFERGEEILLFLKCEPRGYIVMGGIAGKYVIRKDPRSGEKYVFATSFPGNDRLGKEAKRMRERNPEKSDRIPKPASTQEGGYNRVPLTDFMEYLRDVDREQRTMAKQTDPSAPATSHS